MADFRAATPTAAAEILTEGYFSCRAFVAKAAAQLRQFVLDALGRGREDLTSFDSTAAAAASFALAPGTVATARRSSRKHAPVDGLRPARSADFARRVGQKIDPRATHTILQVRRQRLSELERRLAEAVKSQVTARTQSVLTAFTKLTLLSPLNVLDRGYSITTDAVTNKVLQSGDEAFPDSASAPV